MSNNLLELLKEHLSGDVISNLAKLIGESPKNTESALNAALPSLLAGLVEKSADTNCLGNLFNLLTEGSHDGGLLSNLGALSRGGDETSHLMTEGGKLLGSIFGDKSSGIADLITNASGISKASSSSLLNFAAPIVMGLIGKTLKLGKMETATGLASLLGGQNEFLKNIIPAGVSTLLQNDSLSDAFNKIDDPVTKVASVATATSGQAASGFDKVIETLDFDDNQPINETIGNISHKISDVAEETFSAAKNVTDDFGESAKKFGADLIDEGKEFTHSAQEALSGISHKIEDVAEETLAAAKNTAEDFGESANKFGSGIIDEGKEFAHSAANAFDDTANKSGGLLPWILAAAALALVWGLLKSCATTTDTAQEATAPAVTAPTTSAPPVQPAPATLTPAKIEAPITEKLSDFFEATLPSGYAIKAAKDGFESKLHGFINGSEAVGKDLWFTMDGITFDTAKATIKAESNTQINHIAEILKAYPKVEIKIGGYTDNTGKANANLKLSASRANAIKKALISKGIASGRLSAEGYGNEHPVASNDTAEGRQKNRRIDVRVTKK